MILPAMFGHPDTRPFRCLSRNTFYNGFGPPSAT
jgi:hypothetical protein